MLGLLLSIVLSAAPTATLGGCVATDSLTVRNAHAATYDADREAVVVFGGADERQVLGDLWAWDGERWQCLAGDGGGPSPRTFASLAYDRARGQLLLFGGNRVLFGSEEDPPVFLNDMWVWDGLGWRQLEGTMPDPRAEASMVYDEERQRLVLFGGYRIEEGEVVRLGDTWEWDGERWERKSTAGPAPRNGAAMAYDRHRSRTVLFGGSGATGDTWEWNGEQWRRVESADAPGRFNSVAAYDPKRKDVIRFGGWNGEERVGDTWAYDGVRWMMLADEGPAARNHASLVYDEARDVMVVFGGHDGPSVFGDVWEWDGKTWTPRRSQEARIRVSNGH